MSSPSTSLRLTTVAVFSRGISKLPHLLSLLGAERLVFRPAARRAQELDAVIGWGHKRTAAKARRYAKAHGLAYVRLEDGFLRSAQLGHKGPPMSLVVDDAGIYYDASQPCRLENLLNAPEANDPLACPRLIERARRCRLRIVEARLSKYNHALLAPPAWLADAPRPLVLLVDQTWGDASVELGQGNAGSFRDMLEAAVREHPTGTVLVKTHPDLRTGRRRGYLTQALPEGVKLLTDAFDPALLLEAVDEVYTVTSQLGFEALLRRKKVSCFGAPFYAGWGLTDDRVAMPRRQRLRSLDQLVVAALILYPRYLQPITGQLCDVEQAIEHLALQRTHYERNRGRHYCFGFSAWKRDYVRHYLKSPLGRVVFCKNVGHARRAGIDSQSNIVLWGSRELPGLGELAGELGISIKRMEDGFLRSVGLGSDFAPPASLVLDRRGIYYDASQPSDLEQLLQTASFSGAELEQARALARHIVQLGITKYNFGVEPAESSAELGRASGRRVILVPGQVEGDASILLGSPWLRSNRALLGEVRRQNPHAFIIYKVHPDVLSGNRAGDQPTASENAYDALLERTPLGRCLELCDEVHTMTSLVGFEALLRGKRVVTYGQPFYAGWGLTDDRCPVVRRTRRLTLDELVAGALLRYPRYYSWPARAFTSAELSILQLKAQRALSNSGIPVRTSGLMRSWRRGRTWLRSRRVEESRAATLALEGRHVLLLQGPVGPFFQRLAVQLELAGAEVTKVNFNAADDFYYDRPGTIRFRDKLQRFPAFLAKLLESRRVDTLMLFGDCREHHAAALELARAKGIPGYVFEEGYLRPDHVTLERGGVNARSNLQRTLEPYLQYGDGQEHRVTKVENGFRMLAWYSVGYALAATLGSARYPEYRHHKDINAWRQTYFWGRGLVRKGWYALCERKWLDELTRVRRKRFFLVPLQVHHDAQVLDSHFGSNEKFIEHVVASFAKHAALEHTLVFKHHPLDRAYRDYAGVIEAEAVKHGLAERVVYVHDLHLPTLLRAALGVVVLNSTTGCSALHHGTPVKVLGRAVYDISGLTHQGTLETFWCCPGSVVKERFERYREGLIAMSQINGCFYSSNIAQQVVARLTDDGGGSGFAAATVGSPPRTGPDLAAAPADASLPNTEEHSVPDMTVRSVMVQEFGKL